jgi:hypothetical protein
MGTGYVRRSTTEIATGEVIEAADFNNEFNDIVSAFTASTGHSHDGTTAEGGNVTKLLGAAITIGDGSAGADIVVTFDGETSDGVLTWMEDEDHFKFSDDIVVDGTKRLYFNDEGGEYIHGDGTDLNLVSGADINIPASIGLTFGNDGEKIEGDGTDLTVSSSAVLTLDAGGGITIDADSGTITFADGGSSLGTITSSGYSGTAAVATVATTVTITDNESMNEDNALIFTAGGDVDGGNIGLESDGTLTYNPSTGKVTATGFIGTLTGTADTATVATTVTITDNESTNEDNALIFTAGGDVDGGNIGLESDGTLTYNPSTGKVTATGFIGSLTGTADTATVATTVTITDNESTNEDNAIIFTAGGDVDGGNIGLESDGTLTYNPSTGKITATGFIGALTGNVTGNVTGDVTGTADVATVATTVTITDNESTNEDNAIIFTAGGDVDGGNIGLESDGTLTYNPSTGKITATGFIGALTGNVTGNVTGDVTGTADVATVATTVTITDNESTNESNALVFTAGGDVDGGNLGLESDGTLTYNPSTGVVTATGFAGALTGNVTGNASGTAATVTGAAQTNITSVGTLTGLTIGGTTPTLTIGDAGAEDTKIVFDGNAQDYRIGLDDGTDTLEIGLGSAHGTTAHIITDAAGIIRKPLQSSFRAYASGATTLTDGSAVKLLFAAETYDTNADYTTGTSRFTAPVDGRYLFNCSINAFESLGTTDNKYIFAFFYVNNSVNSMFHRVLLDAGNDWADEYDSYGLNGAAIIKLDADDYVEVFIQQNTGADIGMNTGEAYVYFSGELLG